MKNTHTEKAKPASQDTMTDEQTQHTDHDMSKMDHTQHMDHDMNKMDHMEHTDHDVSKMDHMQHMDHDMNKMDHMEHADHDMGKMDHMEHMDHDMSKMDHTQHMDHDMNKMDHMEHMDHDMGGMDHSMHMGNFKQKFWLSLVLALPIIMLSPMMGLDLPFQFTFPGSEWVVLILATILFFYGGQPFLKGAKAELQQKNPAMMTLISMGISVSYVYSVYSFIATNFFHQHVMDFFWELATLIVIMLLGHWIEMSAVANAGNALQKLAELLPDEVIRVAADKQEERVSLKAVVEGDQLIVKAGDKMPTDGVIEKGSTIVDESAVTGESRGVTKNVGDKVIGGSVNGSGTLQIKVTGTGASGYLAKVMEMVRQAQTEKSKLEALSDKVAKWLFYVALAVGIIAFFVWLLLADLPTALQRMVTVFIIACPHALGLAVPLVVARSTSIAAKNGLLLKNRNALENAHDLQLILLDKTGTLTEGTFAVTGVHSLDPEYAETELLKYLGALEANANHPIALGIMKYLKTNGITAYSGSSLKTIAGVGLTGQVQGHNVMIANEKEVNRRQLPTSAEQVKAYQEQGNTISYLLIDERLVGLIALGDKVKPEAKAFIQALKSRGIKPVMLTGDNEAAAANVAAYLDLAEYHAALLPEDKEKIVAEITAKGQRAAMVGDGINDAPSLARATIGVAIGAGTDVAIDSADVVLTNSNPEDILHFIDLAKATRKKMIQNLWWGAGYNILAIPLAAGVFASLGLVLDPAVGAILMSLSTVIVAANALLLKIKR